MSQSDLPPRSKQSHTVCEASSVFAINPNNILVIEENGVRLRLNIVDTPGYGDQVNNDRW